MEITRMWQMKREIIPPVVGALEVINKGSEKIVREIPGNINNNNSSSSSGSGSGSGSCLLYTSPSPRDATLSRMPSSA